MRAVLRFTMACLAAVVLCHVLGCPQPPRITIPVDLPADVGSFDVEPCIPAQRSGVISFEPGSISPGSGAIQLDVADVQVTVPADAETGDCGGPDGTHRITVSAWFAPADQISTLFDTGEKYGPYTLTLDANNVPVSVEPSSIELSEDTMDLIRGGQFSLGVEVVSSVTAEISIEQLGLSFGL